MSKEDELIESLTEKVKGSVLSELNKSKPETEKYDAESFLKHQEMCNTPDCPVCSVMNQKINDVKVNSVLDKVENTIDGMIEKKKLVAEINPSKFQNCMRDARSKCNKKFNRESFLKRARAKIGSKISGKHESQFLGE